MGGTGRRRLEILTAVDKAEASLAQTAGRRISSRTEVTLSLMTGEFILAPEVEAELDTIWLHIARESGSIDIANRVIDSITENFWLLAQHPFIRRRRDEDWRPALRSFPAGEYVIVHRVLQDRIVLILHVIHGSRDVEALLA